MTPKYCLPIIKNRQKDVLRLIDQHERTYDFFEVWLDYIDDLDDAVIDNLQKRLGKRLILLFRRQNLESIRMSLAERQHIMSKLAGKPVLLDLDIAGQQAELTYLQTHRLAVRLIASYHNYQATPPDSKLHAVIKDMAAHHPAIYKLSTYCQSRSDALRLLALLLELREQQRACIVLGMGEAGAITRVFGTLWGNEMIFAPDTRSEKSAPGQLSRAELQGIFKELGR